MDLIIRDVLAACVTTIKRAIYQPAVYQREARSYEDLPGASPSSSSGSPCPQTSLTLSSSAINNPVPSPTATAAASSLLFFFFGRPPSARERIASALAPDMYLSEEQAVSHLRCAFCGRKRTRFEARYAWISLILRIWFVRVLRTCLLTGNASGTDVIDHGSTHLTEVLLAWVDTDDESRDADDGDARVAKGVASAIP